MDKTLMAHEYAKIMLDKIPAYDLGLTMDETIGVIAYIANGLAAKIGVDAPTDNEWQPDWERAPEWANFRAVDQDGKAHWYQRKPVISDRGEWVLSSPTGNYTFHLRHQDYKEDWEKSLYERPSVK